MSEQQNNGDFGAFLAGFVIGGLVGAAVALILAPQSGSQTRTQIIEKGHTFREGYMPSSESAYHAFDEGKKMFTDVKNRLTAQPHPAEDQDTGTEQSEQPSNE